MGGGLIKSLMDSDEDPNAAQRKAIEKALAEINSGRMSDSIKLRGATQRGLAVRSLQDRAAAAGLPQNVMNQNILRATTESDRVTNEALEANRQNQLARKAQLLGMMPATPEDTTGAQLLGIGIQAASSGAFKGMFGGGGTPAEVPQEIIGYNPLPAGQMGPPKPVMGIPSTSVDLSDEDWANVFGGTILDGVKHDMNIDDVDEIIKHLFR